MPTSVMPTSADAQRWAAGLEDLMARLDPRFGRIEPRRRARAYVRGLLAPLERKNGWHLAEAAGDATPDGVQDFLARAHWDAEAVRDDLRAYVVEHFGAPGAVFVLDETGFVKKGTKSVGVQRQYSGTAGRIDNCQVGVFLAYASRHGYAFLDRALYLPESWAADPERRAAAGVPGAVAFTTKPKLGRAMLARALAAGLPGAWVTADTVYGSDSTLRRWCEAHALAYVLAVTSEQHLARRPVAEWIAEVPPAAWQRLSAGDGAKGPRLYDWAYVPYRGAPAGWRAGLLARRALTKRAPTKPAEIAYYLTQAPEGTTVQELVRVAGTRWVVEAAFEAAKGEVGLDQYEVRGWTGWHRHVTLALLAHAYLAVTRAAAGGGKRRRGPRRSPRGPPAAHGAGSPSALVAPRVGSSSRRRARARMVHLAPATPAARAPVALATACAHR
jgi:SRSO17 transposase